MAARFDQDPPSLEYVHASDEEDAKPPRHAETGEPKQKRSRGTKGKTHRERGRVKFFIKGRAPSCRLIKK
jgi:hypothetical protein